MKQGLSSLLAVFLFSTLFFGCCEDEYLAWKKEGEAFLAANKTNPDVTVTSTGLQYKILATSQSQLKPKTTSYIRVNYTASFCNGTIFDSGTNTTFFVNSLISGFKEALLKMKLGEKWILYIPNDLAYGSTGTKNTAGEYVVPPYSVIVYEVELVQIY
jgi:FKBP-type peptidyl-prolyl cis-trans isomerase FklB